MAEGMNDETHKTFSKLNGPGQEIKAFKSLRLFSGIT